MKNRFNWVFDLLKAKIATAESNYRRHAAPEKERTNLMNELREAIDAAREREKEFPDHEQYFLFFEDYVEIVGEFLDGADGEEDLDARLDILTARITELDDTIRMALK